MRSLLIPLAPAIDELWFSQLRTIADKSLEAYAWLGPDQTFLQTAYDTFMHSGMNHGPDLRPQHIDMPSVDSEQQQLLLLAKAIKHQEPQANVRDAYVQRIDELVVNLKLLRAAVQNDKTAFMQANQALYGQPDATLFESACTWLCTWAHSYLTAKNPALARAGQHVLRVLPQIDTKAACILGPNADTFETIRSLHIGQQGFFATLFAGTSLPSVDTIITPAIGDPLMKSLLRNLEAADYKIVDTSDGYWGVRYADRSIVRPHNYELLYPEFLGIVGHEIGSHLLERLNGQRQPLRLLSLGLDHYELGNEGRALMREQIAYPTWEQFCEQPRWLEIILRYFAIAYVIGVCDRQHTFAEAFATILPIYTLVGLIQNPWQTTMQTTKNAQLSAWKLLTRALSGTNGQGSAYLKDTVYLRGNQACWQTVVNHPQLMFYGDHGKFDISNPRHLDIVANL